ncbi:MAG: UDP-N-acetyl glucosamine 2-epimerase [Pseudomonadota bacterium]|nr:UDP-N-acetylglucosamine 2-epimerase (non-hydrolyzing) [Rubrivivax sp.]
MKVLSVFGTRPEAIKLAPLVQRLAQTPGVEEVSCVTAQHRQMLDQVLEVFGLLPRHDLDLMRPGQDLPWLTGAVVEGVARVLRAERPDWLVVQGDTTTAFAAALAGFYERVPVAHVEAGLRTHDPASPWPEEMNRRLVGTLASLHFAPTARAAANLAREGVADAAVLVTGNTVIDALRWTAARPEGAAALDSVIAAHAPALAASKRRWILVTLHRRENLGERLHSICRGLAALAARGDVDVVFPVHLNPAVRATVEQVLGGVARVHRLPPLEYLPFVALLRRCHLVVTDSGGIQEEAPGLGKPVLVARDSTERPEAIEAGTALLAGTDGAHIAALAARLLDDPAAYAAMANAVNPFGDGHSAERIVARLLAR